MTNIFQRGSNHQPDSYDSFMFNGGASCIQYVPQELEDCHMESDDEIMDSDERWEKGAAGANYSEDQPMLKWVINGYNSFRPGK